MDPMKASIPTPPVDDISGLAPANRPYWKGFTSADDSTYLGTARFLPWMPYPKSLDDDEGTVLDDFILDCGAGSIMTSITATLVELGYTRQDIVNHDTILAYTDELVPYGASGDNTTCTCDREKFREDAFHSRNTLAQQNKPTWIPKMWAINGSIENTKCCLQKFAPTPQYKFWERPRAIRVNMALSSRFRYPVGAGIARVSLLV